VRPLGVDIYGTFASVTCKDFVADCFPHIFFDAKLLPAQEPLAHAFGREEGKMSKGFVKGGLPQT